MPLTLNGTTGEIFPSWTTAGRPSPATAGQTGYNSTLNTLEQYNGSVWAPFLSTRSTGSIIQVVSTTYSTTVTGTGNTFTDTGLTASITPTSSSNKILVLTSQSFRFSATAANAGGGFKILRGATTIYNPVIDATGPYGLYVGAAGSTTTNLYNIFSGSYLDSPSTTSSTTYKTQIAGYTSGTSWEVNLTSTAANATNTLILMEVVA